MPDENETTISPPQPKEVCTIRIVFPVTSDEQAIDYKKKITAVLSEITDAQIHFAIMSIPTRPPNGM